MFCPKCGAQLPDGSVFCSACGAQIAQQAAQQVNQAVDQAASTVAPVFATPGAAPEAKPVTPIAVKFNILGAVLTILLFFTLFMPFQSGGKMFITKPEGWFMILIVLAAGFFVFTKMDSFFMLASCAAVFLCFLSLLLIAVGAHGAGTGSKELDALVSWAAEMSGQSTSGFKVPGVGVTFALTLSIGMLVSPIINRLFIKRK